MAWFSDYRRAIGWSVILSGLIVVDFPRLREAVRRRDAHDAAVSVQFEASGNITLDNVREYAETGVDMISIGGLTKNVSAIDFTMLFD